MKRVFQERARLVIYLEQGDLGKVTKMAREEGKTVVEWMREMISGTIEAEEVPSLKEANESDKGVQDVRGGVKVPGDGGRKSNAGRSRAVGGTGAVLRGGGKTCVHGVSKGYNCWKCGGLAKVVVD